jgi:membrane protein YdbS with pleckstrin-like domain
LWLAKAHFNRKKFKISHKHIAYQEGLIFQRETTVPFTRIQHIEIDEGPLERYFGLATLSIYTAGDSGRDLKINGLELQKAQEIKTFISNFMKDE